ncbi:MAG: hypothetical protein ACRDQZ_17210 [Mycobacteriales bacterium]
MEPGRKIDGVSYEFADEAAAKEWGDAINNDTVSDYLLKYPPNNVTSGR